LFLYKNYFNSIGYKNSQVFYKKHLTGYNFYILNNSIKKYLELIKINDDKDYNPIGKVKMILMYNHYFVFNFDNEVSVFFNFNLFLLNLVEIYKILLLLFLKNSL
jgi:hypothetical protein